MVRLGRGVGAEINSGEVLPVESGVAPGEWVLVILVLANLWWTTLCLGGFRPGTMVVAGAVNLATSGCGGCWPAWRRSCQELPVAALATLPFLVYGAVNVSGSRRSRGWAGGIGSAGRGWRRSFWVCWRDSHRSASMVLFAGVVALGPWRGRGGLISGGGSRLADAGQAAGLRNSLGGRAVRLGIPNSLAAFLDLLLPAMVALTFQRGAGAVQRVAAVIGGHFLRLACCFTLSRGDGSRSASL